MASLTLTARVSVLPAGARAVPGESVGEPQAGQGHWPWGRCGRDIVTVLQSPVGTGFLV